MSRWLEGEVEILKRNHGIPRAELTRLINEWREANELPPRSVNSVVYAAWKIKPLKKCRPWTEPEILFLERNCGHPLTQLHQYYIRHGKTQGWPYRTKLAIRHQLNRMGLCADAGEYMSVHEISRHLQVRPETVNMWIKTHPGILSPLHNPDGTYIHKKRIKAFIIKFPGEVEPRSNREQFYLNLLRDSV